MTPSNRADLVRAYAKRYKAASRKEKGRLLDSFCELTGHNRKYAIGLLRAGLAVPILIRQHADFPWSVRLKAILALWLPWLEAWHSLSDQVRKKLLSMSARTIDRLLRPIAVNSNGGAMAAANRERRSSITSKSKRILGM